MNTSNMTQALSAQSVERDTVDCLEFKCSHDNSSICIYHYGLCDVCGKVFSKLNLTYTDEFKRQLCPKHASKNKQKEQ